MCVCVCITWIDGLIWSQSPKCVRARAMAVPQAALVCRCPATAVRHRQRDGLNMSQIGLNPYVLVLSVVHVRLCWNFDWDSDLNLILIKHKKVFYFPASGHEQASWKIEIFGEYPCRVCLSAYFDNQRRWPSQSLGALQHCPGFL